MVSHSKLLVLQELEVGLRFGYNIITNINLYRALILLNENCVIPRNGPETLFCFLDVSVTVPHLKCIAKQYNTVILD
jgi:hypothetical protein